ncbi:MAG: dihydrofolate reductase [Prevotella sp.]|nr:dihydrofolate reductase [Prevotella sp.]
MQHLEWYIERERLLGRNKELEDENADAFFPDYSEWKETCREVHPKDERHEHQYSFVDYER